MPLTKYLVTVEIYAESVRAAEEEAQSALREWQDKELDGIDRLVRTLADFRDRLVALESRRA